MLASDDPRGDPRYITQLLPISTEAWAAEEKLILERKRKDSAMMLLKRREEQKIMVTVWTQVRH